MSHKDLNPVNRKNPKRVAIVISNPVVSTTTGWPVGFWWAELSHPYFRSPNLATRPRSSAPRVARAPPTQGATPEDASQWQAEDVISRGYKHDPDFMNLVQNTKTVDEISLDAFDAIMVAGGRARCSRWRRRRTCTPSSRSSSRRARSPPRCATASPYFATPLCPTATRWSRAAPSPGFTNIEEDFVDEAIWSAGELPRGTHVMPWRIEDEMNKLGANYIQAGLWKGFAIRDGNLITGQQNYSGAETADVIVRALGE